MAFSFNCLRPATALLAFIIFANMCAAQQAWPGFPYESQFAELSDGSRVHYVEEGTGAPIVLVHGAPTQAFLWRHMIPQLTDSHRVIALDLPNFGSSDKVGAIGFPEYTRRFGEFVDALELDDITLVVHDVGGPIALNWANEHRDRVSAVSLLETFVGPIPNVASAPPFFRAPLNLFDPEQANEAAVVNNGFVEGLLFNPSAGLIRRELSPEEQAIYREPFDTQEKRIPLGNLVNEIAVIDGAGHPVLDPDGLGGSAPQTHPNLDYFQDVTQFLLEAEIPIQFVQSNPGGTFLIAQRPFIESQFPGFQIDIVEIQIQNPACTFCRKICP